MIKSELKPMLLIILFFEYKKNIFFTKKFYIQDIDQRNVIYL